MIRTRLLGSAAAAVLAAAALAQTTTDATTTTTTYTTTQASVPFGLAPSETAQVNLVNTASASPSGTAASCTGTIAFFNSSDTEVGSSAFTIASGHIASATTTSGGSARVEIRAVVTLTGTSGVPCQLDGSIETYDTQTGVTHLFLPQTINVVAVGVGPQRP